MIALIHMLLHLYYADVSGVRRQLLGFYREQQPAMPRGYIPGLVRWLIIHYPRAMRSCMAALHASHGHVTRAAVRACP